MVVPFLLSCTRDRRELLALKALAEGDAGRSAFVYAPGGGPPGR
jgi:hypothetical protein